MEKINHLTHFLGVLWVWSKVGILPTPTPCMMISLNVFKHAPFYSVLLLEAIDGVVDQNVLQEELKKLEQERAELRADADRINDKIRGLLYDTSEHAARDQKLQQSLCDMKAEHDQIDLQLRCITNEVATTLVENSKQNDEIRRTEEEIQTIDCEIDQLNRLLSVLNHQRTFSFELHV